MIVNLNNTTPFNNNTKIKITNLFINILEYIKCQDNSKIHSYLAEAVHAWTKNSTIKKELCKNSFSFVFSVKKTHSRGKYGCRAKGNCHFIGHQQLTPSPFSQVCCCWLTACCAGSTVCCWQPASCTATCLRGSCKPHRPSLRAPPLGGY